MPTPARQFVTDYTIQAAYFVWRDPSFWPTYAAAYWLNLDPTVKSFFTEVPTTTYEILNTDDSELPIIRVKITSYADLTETADAALSAMFTASGDLTLMYYGLNPFISDENPNKVTRVRTTLDVWGDNPDLGG